MTSQAQVNANRRNATKSTGPRTEEGKRRSRMNAIRHGGYLAGDDAVSATLLAEDYWDLLELHDALVHDLVPVSTLQYAQAKHIAQQIVNQDRIHRLTTALIDVEAIGEYDADVGQLRFELQYQELLWRAIGSNGDELAPEVPYLALAEAEYQGGTGTDVPPPMVDPNSDDPWEDSRRELFRVLVAKYGSLEQALDHVLRRRAEVKPGADRETRKIRGIEARRLLTTFEKVLSISDRVARSITQDLKNYHALKSMEKDFIVEAQNENDENDENEEESHEENDDLDE